jgi:hypothetical protein
MAIVQIKNTYQSAQTTPFTTPQAIIHRMYSSNAILSLALLVAEIRSRSDSHASYSHPDLSEELRLKTLRPMRTIPESTKGSGSQRHARLTTADSTGKASLRHPSRTRASSSTKRRETGSILGAVEQPIKPPQTGGIAVVVFFED